jgi:hypothetical protein
VLTLIDYDGLWVPALADRPSGEAGHANYQHPERQKETAYGPEVDRFSHLVIYTALRALGPGGQALWQRYDNGENLLFRAADFAAPRDSKLLRELWDMGGDLAVLAGRIVLASLGSLPAVPLLDDLLKDGRPRTLTPARSALSLAGGLGGTVGGLAAMAPRNETVRPGCSRFGDSPAGARTAASSRTASNPSGPTGVVVGGAADPP